MSVKIKWFGQSSFYIEAPGISVVTDPYDSYVGFSMPKNLRADVVTVSHQHPDHNATDKVGGVSKVFDTLGEHKFKKHIFTGVPTFHDDLKGAMRGENIAFCFDLDGLKFVHLGDLGHILSDEQVEKLKGADILFIPVGGHFTINAAGAVYVINQLKPKVVVPMHYSINHLAFPLDDVDAFVHRIDLPGMSMDFIDTDVLFSKIKGVHPEVVILNPKHA